MKRLLTISVFLFLIALILAGGTALLIRRSFPQTSGEVNLPGLNAPVEVLRDASGIPHIYAQDEHDLFMAQGYVHAQDRFWQMDFWRHIGAGRLAEMFGESQIETPRRGGVAKGRRRVAPVTPGLRRRRERVPGNSQRE